MKDLNNIGTAKIIKGPEREGLIRSMEKAGVEVLLEIENIRFNEGGRATLTVRALVEKLQRIPDSQTTIYATFKLTWESIQESRMKDASSVILNGLYCPETRTGEVDILVPTET